MIELLGVTIHDPDVVFTDLGLAALGAYLGWRLWNATDRGTLQTAGAILLAGLASAALWGAIFHAFFPAQTTTLAGFLVWIPVALSVLVVGATLFDLGLRSLWPRLTPLTRRAIVATYAVSFAAAVLLVDESFSTIVRFYGPAVVFFLIAAAREAVRTRTAGWTLVTAGFVVSLGAAVIQQMRVAIHPAYFDHNAVYHVVQGGAVILLYLGFRWASLASTSAYASGMDPAPRQG